MFLGGSSSVRQNFPLIWNGIWSLLWKMVRSAICLRILFRPSVLYMYEYTFFNTGPFSPNTQPPAATTALPSFHIQAHSHLWFSQNNSLINFCIFRKYCCCYKYAGEIYVNVIFKTFIHFTRKVFFIYERALEQIFVSINTSTKQFLSNEVILSLPVWTGRGLFRFIYFDILIINLIKSCVLSHAKKKNQHL